MIEFKKVEQKEWTILCNEVEIFDLKLISSSVTNKFHIITSFVTRVSKFCGDEFDNWFLDFLKEYTSDKTTRFPLLLENTSKIKKYVDSYFDNSEMDYGKFVDHKKAKKNTILFTADEIELIIRTSGYLKVYAIFSNSENLRLSQRLHKKIYNKLAEDILNSETVFNIFNIIKTKTFRYNLTDRYMWGYIKMIQCKSIDIYVVEYFNFIMNSILLLCEEDKNPITYFIGVIDESVKWLISSIYRSTIIYDDSISTEDIHNQSTHNLSAFTYNDTLGRLKGIAFEQIYESLERTSVTRFDQNPSDKLITEFQERMGSIEFVSPLVECFIYPILSKITTIPYNHFRTLTPEHAAVMSIYIKNIFKKVFKGDFKHIVSLLDYYPLTRPAIATSYTVKKVHEFINTNDDYQNFFGFGTKILPHRILNYFVGRISRISFCHIITGEMLPGIPLSKVETDMIRFYALFFANEHDQNLLKMKRIMNSHF